MVSDLKKRLKKEKPVMGVAQVLKKVRAKEAKEVFVAMNCAEKEEVVRLCETLKVKCEVVDVTNVELGVLCRRPHSVSVFCFC